MPWLGCPMRYESVPGTFWMLAPGVPGAQRPGVLLALVRDEDKEEGRALTPKISCQPDSSHMPCQGPSGTAIAVLRNSLQPYPDFSPESLRLHF